MKPEILNQQSDNSHVQQLVTVAACTRALDSSPSHSKGMHHGIGATEWIINLRTGWPHACKLMKLDFIT
jgi:hypothetical protein